jgi:hypothetical protein
MVMLRRKWIFCIVGLLCASSTLSAQEKTAPKTEAKPVSKQAMPDQEALFKKFAETMTGAKLVGNFTVDGMPTDKMIKEEYHIISAEKADKGDYWLITARVKYGKTDITLPMPLEVKWAGKTPVITLDEVTIPGLGTFDAKVVIDGKRYAGTWQHGAFGGLLFGAIERDDPAKSGEKKEDKAETKPEAKKEGLPGAPAREPSAAPAPPKS